MPKINLFSNTSNLFTNKESEEKKPEIKESIFSAPTGGFPSTFASKG